jgi:transcriptional regulator with XRE-family HTH domain
MTQKELANALQISRSTIAGYESESKQPSYEMLVKMAKIFDVSTDYLIEAGLFHPETYDLVVHYRHVILKKLLDEKYITFASYRLASTCPIENCVQFLNAYISDVSGTLDEISYSIRPVTGSIGEKLVLSLSKEQIDNFKDIEFHELDSNPEQNDIVENIENLPYEEQKKIHDYIQMYIQLNKSVAADDSPLAKTGTDNMGK